MAEAFAKGLSDDWENEIDSETVAKLVALVESEKDATILRAVLQAIADVVRVEENRNTLGTLPALFQSTVNILTEYASDPFHPIVTQCIRVVGNLCFQHANNRNAFSQQGIIPLLSTLLINLASPSSSPSSPSPSSTSTSTSTSTLSSSSSSSSSSASSSFLFPVTSEKLPLIRLIGGAVANLASENDDVQDQLIANPKIFELIVDIFLQNVDVDTVTRAVTNIVHSKKQWRFLVDEGGFRSLSRGLWRPGQLRRQTVSIIQELLNDASKEDLAFLVPAWLDKDPTLIQRILRALTEVSEAELAVESAELAEQATLPAFATRPPLERQTVGMLMTKLADCEDAKVQDTIFLPLFERLVGLVRQPVDLIARRCAASTLGYMGYHSKQTCALIDAQLPAFLELLSGQKLPDGDTEVQVGLVMCVALVLDGPERVAKMISLGGHEVLATFLDQQYDPRIVHQALGAIRSLSLPLENKPLLVAAGITPKVNEVLTFSRDVTILYTAVTTLRSLLTKHDESHQRQILESAPVVETLVSLWERYWNPGTERVLWEAARTIALILTDGWLEHCAARQAVDTPLGVLLSSTYPQLRLEGWAALKVISASSDPAERLVKILNTISDPTPSLQAQALPAKDDVVALLSALANPACTLKLQQLDLTNNNLSNDDAPLVSAALAAPSCASLTSLQLEAGNTFSPEVLAQFPTFS